MSDDPGGVFLIQVSPGVQYLKKYKYMLPPHVLKKLSPQSLKRLESVFAHRSAMKPVKSWLPMQKSARPDQILELNRRDTHHYYFLPVGHKKIIPHIPHDIFTFVVPSFSPGKIYCGAPYDSVAAKSGLIKPIMGHTSLSAGKDVLFAVEIEFRHGRMIKWSNNSGHYMPSTDLIYINLIPAVRLILPMDKFVEVM